MRRWKQWLLLRLLNEYRAALSAEGKETAADYVADVMDFVVGFCSSHMRLNNFLGKN